MKERENKENMKSKRMNMIIAGMLIICMALGCSYFTVRAENETEKETEVAAKNDGIENGLMAEPIFTVDPVQIEEEPEVVLGEGTVTDETPSFEYTYTAPRDGKYYIKITNVSSNCYIDGGVYDNLGNSVVNLWGKGDREEVIELEEKGNYTVQIKQYSIEHDNTNFKVAIIAQKETTDISEISEVKDQITFNQQKNVYTFTPKINGRYRFEITDKTANAEFEILAWDSYDSKIMDVITSDYKDGETIELEAGITYTIQVRQDKGIGQYTLHICQQKEKMDVSGYTEINDKIEFDNQSIGYRFVAPVTGTYIIQLANLRSGFEPQCIVYDMDADGEPIAANKGGLMTDRSIFSSYDNGIELEADREYYISVNESGAGTHSGDGDYTISIAYPEEAYDYLKDFQSSGDSNKKSENKDDDKDISAENNNVELSETEQLKQENAELKTELENIKKILKENGIVSDDEDTDN